MINQLKLRGNTALRWGRVSRRWGYSFPEKTSMGHGAGVQFRAAQCRTEREHSARADTPETQPVHRAFPPHRLPGAAMSGVEKDGGADRPIRIHLSRAKGWKMPPNTVKVDRSTIWGNPFTVADCREAGWRGTDEQLAARCVEAFRAWLGPYWRNNWDGPESEAAREAILSRLPELRGKNLACWCKPGSPCHADILMEIANG